MRKYRLAVFLAVFIFAFLPSMQVQAEGSDGFELDGTGTVTLRSQHAAKEEISSLQFSLTVDSAEAAQVEFEFGQNNARIAEFRYDENAKQLNIYMAGVDALFAENTEALTIGKIILRDNSGNAVDGTVSVVENSLQYVYGEELKPMESVEVPGAVLIGPSAQNPPPEQTPILMPGGNPAESISPASVGRCLDGIHTSRIQSIIRRHLPRPLQAPAFSVMRHKLCRKGGIQQIPPVILAE